MALSFRIPVTSVADLTAVDVKVRSLCNTTPGAQCQAILTTEYQSWRRRVALALQHVSNDSHASQPQALDAYLGGFRLRFEQDLCVILQTSLIDKNLVLDRAQKRKTTCCVDDNI